MTLHKLNRELHRACKAEMKPTRSGPRAGREMSGLSLPTLAMCFDVLVLNGPAVCVSFTRGINGS
jgi:hypothetical protein